MILGKNLADCSHHISRLNIRSELLSCLWLSEALPYLKGVLLGGAVHSGLRGCHGMACGHQATLDAEPENVGLKVQALASCMV